MKTKIGLCTVFILLLGSSRVMAAGTTDILATPAGGRGQITVSGSVSIDSNVQKWNGVSVTAKDANNNVYQGFVTLPKGNPTPGGAAVPFTATIPNLPAGTYTVTSSQSYLNKGNPLTLTQSVVSPGIGVK
jgi:hypothetical protein